MRMRTLRGQLMVRFILISLVPAIVIGAFSIWSISYLGLQELVSNEARNLVNITKQLDNELINLRETGIRVAHDDIVRKYLHENIDGNSDADKREVSYIMRGRLMNLLDENKIHSVYVYSMDGTTYTSQPTPVLCWEDLMELDWFGNGVASMKNYFYGEPIRINNTLVLPYVRRIMSKDNNTLLGYCVSNYYESILNNFCMSYGKICVFSDSGTIISYTDRSNIGNNFYDLFSVDSAKGSIDVYLNKNNEHAVINRSSLNRLWVAMIFTYNTSAIINRMVVLSMIVWLLSIIAIIIISNAISIRFVRPLNKIRIRIDALQLGKSTEKMHPRTHDEIGMLMDSINNMTQRLQDSLNEIQRINEMRRKAEYRAIEMQINPHFLYNTLALINYLVDAGENEKVKGMANALSTMFRISVNRGKEMVRVSEELQHLRCYMEILSERHQSEFRYILDVDPDIMEYYTIKIILQPIVENSIQHGIRDNMIMDGIIRITGERVADKIVFEIADNGDISQKCIDDLNVALSSDNTPLNVGIGMRNVNDRIRIFFGDQYGLSYYKHDILTVAHIEIPILTHDIQTESINKAITDK